MDALFDELESLVLLVVRVGLILQTAQNVVGLKHAQVKTALV